MAAKRHAAKAAIEHVRHDCRLGVGTGSTTNEFIAL
ncbi:MAG: ribose 5-phosphate isomerase A, partial [Gammaproteobacteria bacterium]|nr:ribose 5-phosphate isomerase A [Gammaproteobacteria bacterium]